MPNRNALSPAERLEFRGLRTLGALALAVFACAGYWTIRIAIADWAFRLGTPQSIRRAIRLDPGNPEHLSGLARAEPGGAVEALARAVALSPADAGLRVELGLAFESHGDLPDAEASLRKAMELDRTFAPRSVLSGFYCRHLDAENFWLAARSALAISHGDVSGLFRDCWAVSSDAGTILARAIPDRTEVLIQYLNFLVEEKRLTAAAAVAGKILEKADPASVSGLLNYCDHALEAGQDREALAIWNGLSERKLIPYPVSSPEGQEVAVNGDFRRPSMGLAFDWHFFEPSGIYVDRAGSPPGIFISFSGKQSESAEILSQHVPLLPRRGYVLSLQYGVKEISADSGLRCLLTPFDGADLLHGAGLLPGGFVGDTERVFPFVTAEDTRMARLVLAYQRMPGTMRIEGSLMLRKISLTPSREATRH